MALIHRAGRRSVGPVTRLPLSEGLRVETDPILRLQDCLGPQDAALYLREARDELMCLLTQVEMAHASSSFQRLSPMCHRVGSLGLQLGFPGLRDAAANASAAVEIADATAIAATVARLLRLGARAVDEMGELQQVVLR